MTKWAQKRQRDLSPMLFFVFVNPMHNMYISYSGTLLSTGTEKKVMKAVFGAILSIIGTVTLIITGVNAVQQTDSFSFLGREIVVSQGNFAPVIISFFILFMGVLLLVSSKGR
jgi:hypothetical protein